MRLKECVILGYFSFIFEINIIIQSTLAIIINGLRFLVGDLFQFGCSCVVCNLLTDFVFCDSGGNSNEHIMNVGGVLG